MHCSELDSSPYIITYNGPYNSSLASSASSSTASVWSDVASQSSDDSSIGSSHQQSQASVTLPSSCNSTSIWQNQTLPVVEIPQELRQHPRRRSAGSATQSGCPPSLVRQNDRKVTFVDSLVGKKHHIQYMDLY